MIKAAVRKQQLLMIFGALIALLIAPPALANGYQFSDGAKFTYEDFLAWFNENKDVTPQFVDGDVITEQERHLADPFVPPGLQMADFYGEPVTIKDAGDLSPPQYFLDATQQFAGQATIDENGAIANYTAGTPFDSDAFTPGR